MHWWFGFVSFSDCFAKTGEDLNEGWGMVRVQQYSPIPAPRALFGMSWTDITKGKFLLSNEKSFRRDLELQGGMEEEPLTSHLQLPRAWPSHRWAHSIPEGIH